MTFLIGQDGGIHMIANSDWPLDWLVLHHGARAVCRVTECNGKLTVEAREGRRRCLLESASTHVSSVLVQRRRC